MRRMLFALIILINVIVVTSCTDFSSDNDRVNKVDGSYFKDSGFVYHFADSCYFSYPCLQRLSSPKKDCAEFSCKISMTEPKTSSGYYSIILVLPQDSFKIDNNQLILPAYCTVKVKFVKIVADIEWDYSEYSATARFSGRTAPYHSPEDKSIAPCKINLKLSLENGETLLLSFNYIASGSIYRFV